MYGFPDSAVVGTAKRLRTAVFNGGGANRKGEPAADMSFFDWLTEKFENWFPAPADEGLKLARQEYFERYGHYPPGDPR